MIALEAIKSLHGFRWTSSSQFFSSCLLHVDKTGSLRGTVKGDRLLVHCFSCGAGAKAIGEALGLPLSAFFADSRGLNPHERRKQRIAQREREKQRSERERRLVWLATELRQRDAILALDWSQYEGPETWELLGRLYRDYSRLEWEFETLRHPMV